jgi:U4/U6 small nuclear ribonucleoprotein PRP4
MRSLRALYTIPAHTSNVSDVRFFRHEGGSPPSSSLPFADVNMSDTLAADDEVDSSSTPADATHVTQVNTLRGPNPEEKKTVEEWHYRSGLYLASAGYDGLVKIWSADDWQLLRTLTTDNSKVMSVDFSMDSKLLASGTYNRNFQLFSVDDL